MVEHSGLSEILVILGLLSLNLAHESGIGLVQQVFLEEHIGVSLKCISSVEGEALIKRHDEWMSGLVLELPLEGEGVALVEAVLHELDRGELALSLQRWKLNFHSVSVIVECLMVKGERVVHVRVIHQSLRVVALLTRRRTVVLLLLEDLLVGVPRDTRFRGAAAEESAI